MAEHLQLYCTTMICNNSHLLETVESK